MSFLLFLSILKEKNNIVYNMWVDQFRSERRDYHERTLQMEQHKKEKRKSGRR